MHYLTVGTDWRGIFRNVSIVLVLGSDGGKRLDEEGCVW